MSKVHVRRTERIEKEGRPRAVHVPGGGFKQQEQGGGADIGDFQVTAEPAPGLEGDRKMTAGPVLIAAGTGGQRCQIFLTVC